MKRWGVIALMLFAFVAGFTMTYNCGGGSSAEAEGDTDTLQGHPASDFALVDHVHDAGDITSGVLDVSLIPAHTHPDYALSNHPHDEYMEEVDTCSNGQVLKWNGSEFHGVSSLLSHLLGSHLALFRSAPPGFGLLFASPSGYGKGEKKWQGRYASSILAQPTT